MPSLRSFFFFLNSIKLTSRGEYLAVRNAEGSFYLCQSQQNIYRTSKKIRIQWLGEAPKGDGNPDGDLFAPEYYDRTGEQEEREEEDVRSIKLLQLFLSLRRSSWSLRSFP